MGKGRQTVRQQVAREAEAAIEKMRVRAEFRREFIARRGLPADTSDAEIDRLVREEEERAGWRANGEFRFF